MSGQDGNRAAVYETLIRLAERQADSAVQRLARLMRAATDDRSKLEVLERYRVEYRERMSAEIARGVDALSLQNFGRFLLKLDEAIRMQAALVSQRDTDVDRGRGVVSTARRRAKSYATLAERLAEERATIERQREQAQTDEAAMQRHRHNSGNDPSR
jgi:flagellar FliJ protein